MTIRQLALLAVIGLLVVLVSWRWYATPPRALTYTVTGMVTAPMDGATVQVAHDEIPGFMPAMTMPFTLADATEGEGLRPGDLVRFTLRVEQDASRADDLVVTGHDALAARPLVGALARPSTRVRRGDPVPAFALIDQGGQAMGDADLRGHLTVLTFIFTRCPLPEFCPLMMKRLLEVQGAVEDDPGLGPRTRLLSVTLDPEFDTPAVLSAYGSAMGVDFDRWRLVTGAPDDVEAFTKAFAIYTERSGVSIDHTLATALIGTDGRVVEIWRGNGWKTSEVLAALRAASGT